MNCHRQYCSAIRFPFIALTPLSYHRGGSFVKRSLRPKEFLTGVKGLRVPRLGVERLKNEAEALRYIRQHTNIPVPA